VGLNGAGKSTLLKAIAGWGSVFLVAVPTMLLLAMTAPALLPEYRNPLRWPLRHVA
jgi:ABC-type thiamine transport system ATPase subunit